MQLTDEDRCFLSIRGMPFEELAKGEQELKAHPGIQYGAHPHRRQQHPVRFIMVKYLKGFIEQYPHIKITIESQPTTQTLSMLEQQRIDIGLVVEQKPSRNMNFIGHGYRGYFCGNTELSGKFKAS